MTEITKELLARLDVLAAKLGVASEHLWAVLVRQARIEGIAYSGGVLFFLAGMVATALLIRWGWKNQADDSEDAPAAMMLGAVLFCGACYGLGFAAARMYSLIANPEYWALREVLKYLGVGQ